MWGLILAGALILPPSGTAVVVTPGGAMLQPPGGSIVTPGGAVIMDGALLSRPAPSTTTPYSLSGSTVCDRGTLEEVARRWPEDLRFWFDGATVNLPGYRCITLK